MQGTNLFEYAVIRVVPRVDREEFLNAGVILFCPSLKYLDLQIDHDGKRLQSLYPSLDLDELRQHFHAFGAIVRGDLSAGPIARFDLAGRFRWLTATRSTILQTSRVHPGLCADPAATLERLFAGLVLIQ